MDPTTPVSPLQKLETFENCFQQISTSNSVPQGEVVKLIQTAGMNFEEEIMRMQYLQQRGIRITNELATKTFLLVAPKPLSPLAKGLLIAEMGPVPLPNWTAFNIDSEKMEAAKRSLTELQASIAPDTELSFYYRNLKKSFDRLSSFAPNPNGKNPNNELDLFAETVMRTGLLIKTLRSATEIDVINRISDQTQYKKELSQFIIRTPKIPFELVSLLLERLSKCAIAFQDDMHLEIAKKADTWGGGSSIGPLLTNDLLNCILLVCDGIQDATKYKSIMEHISKNISGLHQLNIILTRLNERGISSDKIQENIINGMLSSGSIKDILPFVETIEDEKRRQSIVRILVGDPPPTLQGNGLDRFDIKHLLNHFDKYQYEINFQDEMCSLMAKEFAENPHPLDLFCSLVDYIWDVKKRKDAILSMLSCLDEEVDFPSDEGSDDALDERPAFSKEELNAFLVYLKKYDAEFYAKVESILVKSLIC